VRVNHDCSWQAEERTVYNPANPNNLLAGQNDNRLGVGQCGIDWSTDNGQHWGDLLPPFRERFNDPSSLGPVTGDPNSHTILGGPGTFHTYDGASDPAPAFDSQGRAFFTCVALDLLSNASEVFAVQSPAEAQGSFFYDIDLFSRHFIRRRGERSSRLPRQAIHCRRYLRPKPQPRQCVRDLDGLQLFVRPERHRLLQRNHLWLRFDRPRTDLVDAGGADSSSLTANMGLATAAQLG